MNYGILAPTQQEAQTMAERRQDEDMSAWVTVKEAAALLDVTEQGIRWLLKHGNIAGIKPGRDWLVNRASVEAYRDKRDDSILK